MKPILVFALICLCAVRTASGGEVKHRFVAVDNGHNRLWFVDQFDPTNSWDVGTDRKPRDIRLAPDGKTFLISVDSGAVEYDLATGKATGVSITNQKGIQSAQKLTDGTFLLASQGTIFLCNAQGLALKTIPVAAGSKPYIRLVTVTRERTLLYTAMNPFCINEIDMDGKELATIPLPDKSYKVVRLPNGNYLTSSGDSVAVFEVSPDGRVLKTYGGRQNHPELDLTFNSGWQQLENGNIVATCWHGHGYTGNGPHLVEYTPENKAIWTWSDPDVKQVTNVLLLK